MKTFITALLISLYVSSIQAQTSIPPSLVKWYSLQEALKLSETNPRPILLDVYTDWCSWCKFMMRTTYANKAIADYINANFYPAKFNAESFDTITFKGQKYGNRRIGSRPSHDLASILLDGKLSYPSVVFFDREGNKTVIPGYKEAKDFEPILVYFAENVNRTASLDDFYLNFMYSFPSAYTADHSIFKIDAKLKPDTLGKIIWTNPAELDKLQKKKPRQVILFFYTGWSNGSTVMEKTVLRDRQVVDKINSMFYISKIDAASNDTIQFLGKKFAGTGENMPNQLTYSILNNNFHMPATVFFDEKNNIKGMINGFWAKKQFLPLLDFFYSNANQKMRFEDFIATYKF
jgi:thioredoxin-related protein